MISEAAARALAPLRAAYREQPIPSVVVQGAVSSALSASLREELRGAGLAPYWVADRGRYAVNAEIEAPELFDSLRELAEHLAEVELEVTDSRFALLRRGDYSLRKDDAEGDPPSRSLELTLDLSERATGEAEVVYTHRGDVFFVAPQEPGAVALVERGPTVRRYERYLTHRVGEAEVFRLRLALRVVGA